MNTVPVARARWIGDKEVTIGTFSRGDLILVAVKFSI